jgi:hypothetical protein
MMSQTERIGRTVVNDRLGVETRRKVIGAEGLTVEVERLDGG